MDKYGIIKVADGLYADTGKVIENVIINILSSIDSEVRIGLKDIRGYGQSRTYIRDGKIYKEIWDEDHYGHTCVEDEFFVSDKPEDLDKLQTAMSLMKLYSI